MANNKKTGCGLPILIVVLIILSGVVSMCSANNEPVSSGSGYTATGPSISFPEYTWPTRTEPTTATSTYEPTTGATEAATIPPTTQPPVVDRLPGLDSSYDTHLFLDAKGYGACTDMTGDILLTFLFVDDADSSWTQAAIDESKAIFNESTAKLQASAQDYGQTLRIHAQYIRCTAEGSISMKDYMPWVKSAVASAGFNYDTACADTATQFGVDQAAFVLCVNREGRAFAMPQTYGGGFEGTVLFTGYMDYRHELCHLFGAEDFYFPEEVKTLAEQKLPESVMNGGDRVDPLTAYLIGWTDTPDASAKSFLDETAWITPEYMSEAYKQETFTGYGTKRYLNGTYTGYMVDGLPHGKGKELFDDGTSYDGDWVNGAVYGQCTWVMNGGTYTGEVKNWALDGYGTFYWSSGTYYVGYWSNNNMHGQGTCYFNNGVVQSGTWNNGTFVG